MAQNAAMRILSVSAELHVFGAHVNYEEPLRFAVNFDDGSLIRLRGMGDGEGVIIDRLPLEKPMDFEEYGRTATFDVTERLDETLRNSEVHELLAIRSPSSKLIGLALARDGAEHFCIWMDGGDEFRWGPESVLTNWTWAPGGDGKIGGAIQI